MTEVTDTSSFDTPCFSLRNRAARALWLLVYCTLFRFSPRFYHPWRAWLLRLFGARLGHACKIYPQAVVWAPWNLVCGDMVAIASGAEIYNPSLIELGDYATISQNAFLCGASHDYTQWTFPLISKPIRVEQHAWVAAHAIVNMGITISEGCVIGAGSIVVKDMPAWSVCGGNPCRVIKPYEKHGDPRVLELYKKTVTA